MGTSRRGRKWGDDGQRDRQDGDGSAQLRSHGAWREDGQQSTGHLAAVARKGEQGHHFVGLAGDAVHDGVQDRGSTAMVFRES